MKQLFTWMTVWSLSREVGGGGVGQRVSTQAGFIIIIKPDQRTGIKMRPGLTHNGCVEEFRGSKCGTHFRCVNNEHHTLLVRQEGAFQPKQGRVETTRHRFQRAAFRWKREKRNQFCIFCIDHPCESILALCPDTLQPFSSERELFISHSIELQPL